MRTCFSNFYSKCFNICVMDYVIYPKKNPNQVYIPCLPVLSTSIGAGCHHGLADQGLVLYHNFTLKNLCKALQASAIVIVWSLYQL